MDRKLYRSRTDSRIAGVCGGLGEFLGLDPTVVRLVFVLLALLGGHGILIYLIMWLVMPPAPETALVAKPPSAQNPAM
jgi:phage shock protein C